MITKSSLDLIHSPDLIQQAALKKNRKVALIIILSWDSSYANLIRITPRDIQTAANRTGRCHSWFCTYGYLSGAFYGVFRTLLDQPGSYLVTQYCVLSICR